MHNDNLKKYFILLFLTTSCWQNNEIAGIIKLNVIGEIEFKLNHHVILIGAIVIISVILIIFWRAFKGRTRYTLH